MGNPVSSHASTEATNDAQHDYKARARLAARGALNGVKSLLLQEQRAPSGDRPIIEALIFAVEQLFTYVDPAPPTTETPDTTGEGN